MNGTREFIRAQQEELYQVQRVQLLRQLIIKLLMLLITPAHQVELYQAQHTPANYTATGTTNYSCNSGDVLASTICSNVTNTGAAELRTYSCPEGILSGLNCKKQINDHKPGICEVNYTFIGNRCVQN